jgi:hypothetical protein
MINCKNCINWMDESLEQVEADHNAHSHIFMGCRIFGFNENNEELQNCKYYRASENLFTICISCRITVPKVCVSLGECANCTDTDLFCVQSCKGDENRKYCTHFIRLHTEGMHLIKNGRVYDLFPSLRMPGDKKSVEPGSSSNRPGESSDDEGPESCADCSPAKSSKL